jgi:hypothetical protein
MCAIRSSRLHGDNDIGQLRLTNVFKTRNDSPVSLSSLVSLLVNEAWLINEVKAKVVKTQIRQIFSVSLPYTI